MVFPLFDDNSDRKTFPYVNYALIVANVLVFVFLQQLGTNDDFTYAFSTVPEEILSGEDVVTGDRKVQDPMNGHVYVLPGLRHTPLSVYLTLLTSMFMHGGIVHIAGNMLFLWIFGDNVEDYLGHLAYLIFYLTCGVAASLAHVVSVYLFHGDMLMPCLGASGAISGVLGGYIILFPHRGVTVILFRFLTQVPAWVAIGIWFVFQIISGIGTVGNDSQAGGVAYTAHIGGFLTGIALVKSISLVRKPAPRRFAPPW